MLITKTDKVLGINNMLKISKIFIIIAVILLILSAVAYYKGYDCKTNYHNSEWKTENAYVGGDAYNYIINGTYFTGFMVLSASCGLGAIILLSTGLILYTQYSQQEKPVVKSDESSNDE